MLNTKSNEIKSMRLSNLSGIFFYLNKEASWKKPPESQVLPTRVDSVIRLSLWSSWNHGCISFRSRTFPDPFSLNWPCWVRRTFLYLGIYSMLLVTVQDLCYSNRLEMSDMGMCPSVGHGYILKKLHDFGSKWSV